MTPASPSPMRVVNNLTDLHLFRGSLSGRLALVPTMGALHDGHMTLVKRARERADHVWLTIFVNPTQFAPHEDFDRYPRDLEADLERCRDHDVELVFTPTTEQIYPPGQPAVSLNVPELASDLEAAARPTHFPGVCRVVAKLLNLTRPDVACFGQKDYQQLAIVRAMAADLAMPVRIEAVPTARETDGLAMSSRNRYLTPEQRPRATALHHALQTADQKLRAGEKQPQALEQAMRQILTDNGLDTDYAVVRNPQTLARLDQAAPGDVALIAARLGSVRLIDNMILAAT